LNNYNYKEQLFLHLDGITIIPTTLALKKIGILDFLKKRNSFILSDIENQFTINKGYLNIAIRALLSIGVFKINSINSSNIEKEYFINHDKLELIIKNIGTDSCFLELMKIYIDFKNIADNNDSLTNKKLDLLDNTITILKNKKSLLLENGTTQTEEFLYYFIEGLIVGPILSYLGYYNLSQEDIKNKNLTSYIGTILTLCNLINPKGEFTKKGLFFRKRFTSYGVTSSYLPLLSNLELIISKNLSLVWERDHKGDEIHVNRGMNVWGSGGSHKYYFEHIDKIIIDVFNKNIEDQPEGIIDVGCGNGVFLKHCYDIIINNTVRKKYLKEYPLILIGVDINKAARIASRKKLNTYDISNIILNGNISDPDSLNKRLDLEYNKNLNNFLNTRTFLDHNRIYYSPKELRTTNITTSGSFCYKGRFIDDNYLINNLIEHFSNWKKYINKYGLIILELHTINPYLTMSNRGKTLACAYDTIHGFSDQYLVVECLQLVLIILLNHPTCSFNCIS